MARLVVVEDATAVAEAAADRVVAVLGGAIEVRGVGHVALTGGSTAGALYEALLDPARQDAMGWGLVEAWWGDDRLVPRADPRSNVRAAEIILAPERGLGLDPRRVHPFPIDEARELGNDDDWIATTYAARLRERVPAGDDGMPVFDLVLLGMGPDGHILSVFADSPALAVDAPIVLAVPAPTHVEPHVARVTLSPRLVAAARAVIVMVSGAAKASALADVLGSHLDPTRLPAQLATGRNATWVVDAAAAAGLGSSTETPRQAVPERRQ